MNLNGHIYKVVIPL